MSHKPHGIINIIALGKVLKLAVFWTNHYFTILIFGFQFNNPGVLRFGEITAAIGIVLYFSCRIGVGGANRFPLSLQGFGDGSFGNMLNLALLK